METKEKIQQLFDQLPLYVVDDNDREWEIVITRDSFGAVIKLVDTGYEGASQEVMEGSTFDGDLRTALTGFLKFIEQFRKNQPMDQIIVQHS